MNNTHSLFDLRRAALTLALLLPVGSRAQQPAPAAPAATPAPASVLSAPGVQQPPFQLESAVAQPAPAATPAPLTKPAAAMPPLIAKKGEIIMNFQGASLNDVLNYLSEAAGFVIVQETPVSGTVNVMSRQAISPEEAVDLVNTVLIEKGFIAIRNGRILKIVKREGAQKRDLPVQTGSDPEKIPRNDGMVTQILPLRFGEAAKLVENLRPLLPDNATITANESSNSILMTDTQTNIRRMAEIIRAIDTSVASISTIHVYPLQYANAKELSTVITQLFANNTTSGQNNQNQRGGGRRGGFGGFPGFPGGGDSGAQASAQSEARQANSRVIAVADDQSNSLIVSAPEDLIPQITDIVNKIDTSTTDVTSTRIFNLIHADAVETADIINTLYSDATSQASSQSRNRNGSGNNRGGQQFGGFPGQPQAAAASGSSDRALMQARVVAVGDPRTNSLLVNAARDTLAEIAEMIGRLDATDAKKQHVYVHSLEHADVDGVASVLRGMLGDTSANNSQTAAGRLSTRSAQGASMDTTQSSNTNGSGGGGGSRGR